MYAKNPSHPCVLDEPCFPERGNLIMPVFQGISNSSVYTSHLGVSLKCTFWSVGLGWGLRCCTSNKLPRDVNTAGP